MHIHVRRRLSHQEAADFTLCASTSHLRTSRTTTTISPGTGTLSASAAGSRRRSTPSISKSVSRARTSPPLSRPFRSQNSNRGLGGRRREAAVAQSIEESQQLYVCLIPQTCVVRLAYNAYAVSLRAFKLLARIRSNHRPSLDLFTRGILCISLHLRLPNCSVVARIEACLITSGR